MKWVAWIDRNGWPRVVQIEGRQTKRMFLASERHEALRYSKSLPIDDPRLHDSETAAVRYLVEYAGDSARYASARATDAEADLQRVLHWSRSFCLDKASE